MSTIKVDTIATRTGSGNITASNTIAGTSATLSGTLGVGETSPLGKLHIKSGDSAVSSVNANANELVVENSDYTGISILGENETNIMFGDNEDPDVGRIEYHHSDNSMRFRTNASDAIKIDSSGRTMIGTTTEGQSAADDLTVASSGNTGITIRAGTTSSGSAIYMSDATSGTGEYAGYIAYSHSADSMAIGAAAGQRIRIDSDGLKFGGDSAAANALNDYEVGTYTPTVTDALGGGNACSLSSSSGRYVKIGNLVWVHIDTSGINTTGITTNNVLCFLLPFSPSHSSYSSDFYWANINYDPNDIPTFQIISGYIRGRFILSRDNTTAEYLRENTINDGNSSVGITMVYYTA